ncbi:hypothetical protein PFISCL1PPCAC_10404, partial [Pristionchus fissidentatus]
GSVTVPFLLTRIIHLFSLFHTLLFHSNSLSRDLSHRFIQLRSYSRPVTYLPYCYRTPTMADYNKVESEDIEKAVGDEAPPKKHHREHKKSVYVHRRTCSACGHVSEKETNMEIYPPPRPITAVHQQNFNFIGYVVVIALVIFLTFVAVKYVT